jgi:hypothetical protein
MKKYMQSFEFELALVLDSSKLLRYAKAEICLRNEIHRLFWELLW